MGARGGRFDPFYPDHALIAQLVEHLTCNEDVVGSIPAQSSKWYCDRVVLGAGLQNLLHWFESSQYLKYMLAVAQLVRASDCGSEGRGFDSHRSPKWKVI